MYGEYLRSVSRLLLVIIVYLDSTTVNQTSYQSQVHGPRRNCEGVRALHGRLTCSSSELT